MAKKGFVLRTKDIVFVIMVFILFACLFALVDYANSEETSDRVRVERHIDHFRRNLTLDVHLTKTEAIKQEYVSDVLDAAKEEGIDPLLLAVTISAESSWIENVRGDKGEIGLCQIMPKSPFAKGKDLATRQGLLRACSSVLKHCSDKCGTVIGTFTCYQTTGRCAPPTYGAKMRTKWFEASK